METPEFMHHWLGDVHSLYPLSHPSQSDVGPQVLSLGASLPSHLNIFPFPSPLFDHLPGSPWNCPSLPGGSSCVTPHHPQHLLSPRPRIFHSLDSRSVEKANSLSLSLSLWQHHLGPGHDAYFCLKMSVFWFLKGKDVRAAFTLLGWERFSLVLHSPFRLLPITWRTALAVCSLPVLHKHVCQTLLFFLFPSYLILNITFSHLLGASVLVWSLYKSVCAQVCTGFK